MQMPDYEIELVPVAVESFGEWNIDFWNSTAYEYGRVVALSFTGTAAGYGRRPGVMPGSY